VTPRSPDYIAHPSADSQAFRQAFLFGTGAPQPHGLTYKTGLRWLRLISPFQLTTSPTHTRTLLLSAMRAASNIYEHPEAISGDATPSEIGRAAATVAVSMLAVAVAGYHYLL
jgi:hypothetical protein